LSHDFVGINKAVFAFTIQIGTNQRLQPVRIPSGV